MTEETRSAVAQAGVVDSELLIFDCAKAFHNAQTQARLDAEWAAMVRPAYDQLSERSLAILNHLYGLNSTVIQKGLR